MKIQHAERREDIFSFCFFCDEENITRTTGHVKQRIKHFGRTGYVKWRIAIAGEVFNKKEYTNLQHYESIFGKEKKIGSVIY